jgi:hypothetical protein
VCVCVCVARGGARACLVEGGVGAPRPGEGTAPRSTPGALVGAYVAAQPHTSSAAQVGACTGARLHTPGAACDVRAGERSTRTRAGLQRHAALGLAVLCDRAGNAGLVGPQRRRAVARALYVRE